MTWSGLGRPKGHILDSPSAIARLQRLLVPHAEVIGVASSELEPVDWNVGWSDQGDESSCTGHGNEKMVRGTAIANGLGGARCDEHGIYGLRAEDYPELAITEPLPDEGAMPATIQAGLARFGVLAAGDGPRGVGDRLDVLQLERASGFRVPKVARIALGGDALIDAVLRALARGCGSFCMQVDKGYEALTDGELWSGPDGSPLLGGHCQGFGGWRRGDGVEIKVCGSWGQSFGCIWMPAAKFAAVATDVYVGTVAPRVAAAPGGLS